VVVAVIRLFEQQVTQVLLAKPVKPKNVNRFRDDQRQASLRRCDQVHQGRGGGNSPPDLLEGGRQEQILITTDLPNGLDGRIQFLARFL
jgi:hypothetical protein